MENFDMSSIVDTLEKYLPLRRNSILFKLGRVRDDLVQNIELTCLI